MKIVLHTQYYPPEIGAPQTRLAVLAQAFVERGHEVTVLTAMPNYPRGQIYSGYGGLHCCEVIEGVKVLRSFIYPTKSVGFVRRMGNYLSFVASSGVVGAAVLPRADVLITESPPLFLGLSGWLLSRLKRARWVFNVSDLWPESAVRLGVIRPGLGLRLAERLEAFSYQHAWLVTGQSREILSDIAARFPDVPTFHLSNGVETSRFRPDLRSDRLRAELLDGLTSSCVAIYAGLHGIAQGLEQVLEAAAKLRETSELAIVFVGDGPEKGRLIRQANGLGLKNVRFLDPRPREAMPALMASADIALVPLGTRLPGAVPSKLYEAMGSGLPVVLAADGEAARIVNETGAGLAVRPGDSDGLAGALSSLAADSEMRHRMGRDGRAAVEARFDRRKIADAFTTHLEDHFGADPATTTTRVS